MSELKPRVFSQNWTNVSTGEVTKGWAVEFEDSCGCPEYQWFTTFHNALRFAHHVVLGGSRWEFVA